VSLLAIIPARGGSKGIPGKNLIELGGRSLVARAIDAAAASEAVTSIFVTTDDDDIACECEKAGVGVSYRRPSHLADDHAGMLEVVEDALVRHGEQSGIEVDNFVLLQPTCPFRSSHDIDACWALFGQENYDTVVSVHEVRESPYECVREHGDGYELLARAEKSVRRQDYQDKFYFINGAIYMVKSSYFKAHRKFFKEGETGLFHMDPLHGIDIDIPADLLMAQALIDHPEFNDRMYSEDRHVPVTDLS